MPVCFYPLMDILKQVFISLPLKLALIALLDKTLCHYYISSIYTSPRVDLSLLPMEREQAREKTEDKNRAGNTMSFPQIVS